MSNTTAPVAPIPVASAPVAEPAAALSATDVWLQIIPAAAAPMAFTSLAALVSAVLFGRWLAVVVCNFVLSKVSNLVFFQGDGPTAAMIDNDV